MKSKTTGTFDLTRGLATKKKYKASDMFGAMFELLRVHDIFIERVMSTMTRIPDGASQEQEKKLNVQPPSELF